MSSESRDTRTARQKWGEMMDEARVRGYLFYQPDEIWQIRHLILDTWDHKYKTTERPEPSSQVVVEHLCNKRRRMAEGVRDDTPERLYIMRTRYPPVCVDGSHIPENDGVQLQLRIVCRLPPLSPLLPPNGCYCGFPGCEFREKYTRYGEDKDEATDADDDVT